MTKDLEFQQEVAVLRAENKALQAKITSGKRMTVAYRRLIDIERALNSILSVSQQHLPLHESLSKILDIILEIPWLALEKKGCIFITEHHNPEQLRMAAYRNLNEPLLAMCNRVAFGHCLCGQAAMSRKRVYKNLVDEDHTHRPEGMEPHGHYIVPILVDDTVKGVLTLYIKPDHKFDRREARFLEAVAGILSSIIASKQYEQQLSQMSYEDELTGLPNRRAFLTQLDRTMRRAKRSGEKFAVFFLDLDRFKVVNDTWGHDTGDLLLKRVADRLTLILRGIDMVARFGGDEFTVITELITSTEEVKYLGERMVDEINRPFMIGNIEVQIGASLGVSLFPGDGDTAESLLKKADDEMYLVKLGEKSQTISSLDVLNELKEEK